MKLLMLINNNLKYDSRVKRHIGALSKQYEEVTVCFRPIPDDVLQISLPNVRQEIFKWEPFPYPASKQLMLTARNLDIYDDIWPVAPMLLEDYYYEPSSLEFEKQIQDTFMNTPQWEEVLQGIPEEMDLFKQMGWVTCFLDCSIQWADLISNIEADVVYCNDIDTLTAGVVHKKKYNSRLVYDAHDIYCDIFPGIFPRMHRNMLALLERQLLCYADVLIGVSQSELDWIQKTYRTDIPSQVIHNCTENKTGQSFAPKNFSLPIRLYYHGNADATRGIENVIDAIALTTDVVFNLRCLPGDYLDYLKKKVAGMGLKERVRFLDPVDSSKTAEAAYNDGDIGIHACSNLTSVDIDVSLTNKFIEYLKAGLPVITSPVPEQARIIRQYQAGFVLSNNSAEEIASVLNEAKVQISKLQQMSQNAFKASAQLFNWTVYEKKLIQAVTGNGFPQKRQRSTARISDGSETLSYELQAWKSAAYLALNSRNSDLDKLKQYEISISQNAAVQKQYIDNINEKEETIRKYSDIINEKEETIRKHSDIINEKEETIRKYSDIINEKEETIRKHLDIINEKEETIRKHSDIINENAETVLLQNNRIAELQALVNNYEYERKSLFRFMAALIKKRAASMFKGKRGKQNPKGE